MLLVSRVRDNRDVQVFSANNCNNEDHNVLYLSWKLLLHLTHGLIPFKLLCGLRRCTLGVFRPPSVIPNLGVGRPNNEICNCVII
jgi:hypothetical protein